MSLRSEYYSSHSAALQNAATAGDFLITSSLVSIGNEIATFASQGLRAFTISLSTTYQTGVLRTRGELWEAYRSGVLQAILAQEIFAHEIAIELNTGDLNDTKVDLEFSF